MGNRQGNCTSEASPICLLQMQLSQIAQESTVIHMNHISLQYIIVTAFVELKSICDYKKCVIMEIIYLS